MQSWYSSRFAKTVHLTQHAAGRMSQRGIGPAEVADLIETGAVKEKDSAHWWIFKEFAGRRDNLVCAAVIARQGIIIKTLMTHWEEHDA